MEALKLCEVLVPPVVRAPYQILVAALGDAWAEVAHQEEEDDRG